MADEGEIFPPNDNNGSRAAAGLIPQPHGGALLPRLPAGAPAQGVSMRRVRKEIRAMMSGAAVEKMQKLLTLCDSADDRVAVVAVKEFNDRFYGKLTEMGFGRDEDGTPIDLTKYPKETQDEIMHLLARLTELTGVGAGEE